MLTLHILEDTFAVLKTKTLEGVDFSAPFTFCARTDEELSFVLPEARIPSEALAVERGFRGFRIEGVLDFSLVGILAAVSKALSERGISLFAVSTFNTDYIFVKETRLAEALDALSQTGLFITE